MRFSYQAEKFSIARRELMLPHSRGQADAIVNAFHASSLALEHFDRNGLDDDVRRLLCKLDQFLDTTGIKDPFAAGTWLVKAEKLTHDQKVEFSGLIDNLASWFERNFWEEQRQGPI